MILTMLRSFKFANLWIRSGILSKYVNDVKVGPNDNIHMFSAAVYGFL